MKYIMTRLFFSFFIFYAATTVNAQVVEAVVGTAKTSAVLSGIKDTLVSTVDEAADRMDYSVALGALRMLEAIDSWEKANTNLLDKAFDELDQSTQDIFSRANSTLSRASGIAENSLSDVDSIVTNLNQISESTIISEKRSYILRQWPLVSPIDGNDIVTVRLSGVNLDKAEPSIEIEGERISRRLLGPTKVEFDIPKKYLAKTENKISIATFTVKHKTRDGSYLFVIPKYKDVERQISLATLPDSIGSYEIEVTRSVESRKVETYTGNGGKFKGRNTTKHKVIKPKDGFLWLIDDRSKFKVVSTGSGEAGKCHRDIGWNSSSQHGISISARLDEIREVNLGGVRFKSGYKHCGLKGPIYKVVVTEKKEILARSTLQWNSDGLINLPADTKSFVMRFKTFQGNTFVINNSNSDSKFFELIKSSNKIILKPKLLSDFI